MSKRHVHEIVQGNFSAIAGICSPFSCIHGIHYTWYSIYTPQYKQQYRSTAHSIDVSLQSGKLKGNYARTNSIDK